MSREMVKLLEVAGSFVLPAVTDAHLDIDAVDPRPGPAMRLSTRPLPRTKPGRARRRAALPTGPP
ncbi:MAG: hypothetical protein WBN29_03205, partial [Polyangiales bacterium]